MDVALCVSNKNVAGNVLLPKTSWLRRFFVSRGFVYLFPSVLEHLVEMKMTTPQHVSIKHFEFRIKLANNKNRFEFWPKNSFRTRATSLACEVPL